ncbi:hypothetical protein ACJRPK_13750 [Aquimarina sp. 2-A2]|uniref:hypothetical protein n=1 Tax=Aquimarina sp. 2-A2 TaxID=3382644 RepID=UPI00387F1BE6
MDKTKRLIILENSLEKKKQQFSDKLQHHFDTVKQANGQPLNDKRNGQATLNKWEKQNDSLINLNESIAKTEDAIEREKGKIIDCESVKNNLPGTILEMIENGRLTQWRKHPNTFFVDGVDKARIVWDNKKKIVAHKYINKITDKDQWKTFAKTYNELFKNLNK